MASHPVLSAGAMAEPPPGPRLSGPCLSRAASVGSAGDQGGQGLVPALAPEREQPLTRPSGPPRAPAARATAPKPPAAALPSPPSNSLFMRRIAVSVHARTIVGPSRAGCAPAPLRVAPEGAGAGVLPAAVLGRPRHRRLAPALALPALAVVVGGRHAAAALAEAPAAAATADLVPAPSLLGPLVLEAITTRLLVHEALIVFHRLGALLGQGEGQALQRCGLDVLHKHKLGGLVPEGGDLLLDHHLGDDRVDNLPLEVEHLCQLVQMEGVVDGRIREEVRSQRLRLNLALDHLFDPLAVDQIGRVDVVPKLQILKCAAGALPVAALQRLCGADHGLAVVLGRAREGQLVIGFQRPSQDLGNHALVVGGVDGLHGEVGDLQQHGADEVGGLEDLQVDVHVVRKLPQPLLPLLLRRPIHVLVVVQALCKQLPCLVVHVEVHQTVVRILDLAKAEGAEAHLGKAAVVQNLGVHVGLHRLVGEVPQLKEVARRLEAVMQR
mmetsp:Transcript_38862/g.122382  ORF Transcript_38862/g.122382 Transcript_38862/m.122382 type:complete len:496 (+) Transcript_38862:3-1490(+)